MAGEKGHEMTMMDLKGRSPEELDRLEFELARRENLNAALRVSEFRKYFGKTVKVVKGRKVPKGTVGECFWMGCTDYSKYGDPWGIYTHVRVGIRDTDGNVHWTALDNVELVREGV